MFEAQAANLMGERSGLVRFTCWATWVFAIPTILILVGKMSGLTGFWNADNVNILIPLPYGIAGLLLFLMSTIGLWQMQPWGVYLYGVAGLLSVILMLVQAVSGTVLPANLPNALQWMLIGLAHLAYTLKLWRNVPGR